MATGRSAAKKKTSRAAPRPKADTKKAEVSQLVITLGTSDGEITKIEHLGSAGKRRTVSEAELTSLLGDDEMEDLCEALEAAYAAGIQDGFEEAIKDDPFAESGAAQQQQRAQDSAGDMILQAGVRRTVVKRVLRHSLGREDAKAKHNGAQEAR